jgi:hypothetical protein
MTHLHSEGGHVTCVMLAIMLKNTSRSLSVTDLKEGIHRFAQKHSIPEISK